MMLYMVFSVGMLDIVMVWKCLCENIDSLVLLFNYMGLLLL